MHDLVIRFFFWKIETSLRIRMHSIFVYVTCYSDNLWVRSLTLRKWKSDLISVWKEEDTIKFNGSKVKEIEVVDDGMMEGHENGRVGLSQRQSLSLMFFFCFLKPSLYSLHVHLLPCVSFFFFVFLHHTTCLCHSDVFSLPQVTIYIQYRKIRLPLKIYV